MVVPDTANVPGPASDLAPPDPSVAAVLRDAAALWEAVQHTAGDYIVVVDRRHLIRGVNRVGSGYTVDQVVGSPILDFTVGESRERLGIAIDEVFASGGTRAIQTRVRLPDGVFGDFSVKVGPVLHGGRIAAVIVCCEEITALKVSERALQRERGVLRHLLEIQERERQLVSYEIHDGLAQYLAGAVMHLEAYAHEPGTRAAPREFEEGMRLLQAATDESRRLIGGLRPPALDELGIVDAIESIVAEARIDVPQITFSHRIPRDRLPPQLETIIFRIVQEALTNARKHAAARHIDVWIERTDGHVRVRVHDDGKGFDPGAVPEERFGLEGIRQRCRLLGGEPRIASVPGAGTTIEATLPIPAGD